MKKAVFLILFIFALLMSLLFTIFSVLGLVDVFKGEENGMLMFLTFGIADLFTIGFTVYAKKSLNTMDYEKFERFVLGLANKQNGLVSAVDIAENSSYTLTDATKRLNKMYVNGICQHKNDDATAFVYEFPTSKN